MAYTYAQLQDIKDRIVRDLAEQQARIELVKATPADISAKLTGMQSTYGGAGGWAAQVNAMATANPSDAAIQALKAERDLLVSEFASAKAIADALNTAVNS